jgi:hypothetical protein
MLGIRPRALGLLLVTVLVAGCSNRLFFDDFEDYAPGSAVGGGTPPPPEGDTIVAQGSPENFTIGSADAIAGQLSLQLERGFDTNPGDDDPCPPPAEDPFCQQPFVLFFVPETASPTADAILYTWRGRYFPDGPDPVLEFSLFQPGAFFGTRLRLAVHRDRLTVIEGITEMAELPLDFRRRHRIILRLDPGTLDYAVQVTDDDQEAPPNDVAACTLATVACGTLQPSEGVPPARWLLRIAYALEGVAPASRYVMDSAVIWER